jgi:hypothetical protein
VSGLKDWADFIEPLLEQTRISAVSCGAETTEDFDHWDDHGFAITRGAWKGDRSYTTKATSLP